MIIGIDNDKLKFVADSNGKLVVTLENLTDAIVPSSEIKNAPTVDAIPIEYIKNQIGRWERSKCQSYHAICYRHLIEEWKMENEMKEE